MVKSIVIVFMSIIILSTIISITEYDAPDVPPSPEWRYRPLIAGLKIESIIRNKPGYVSVGSIGFPAYYRKGLIIYYGFVTAGHVLDDTDLIVYQNTTTTYNNFAGFVYFLKNDILDFAFVWVDYDICSNCFNWPSGKILPRFWYNSSGIVSYGFIMNTWSSDPYNLLGHTIFKVGQKSRTTFGKVIMVYYNNVEYGGSHRIFIIGFDATARRGDSGGFVGKIYTLAGATLIGYVFAGGEDLTLAVYYNITNVFRVEPHVCPEGYNNDKC